VLASLLLGGTGTPESGTLFEIVLPKEPVLWALGTEVVGRTTSSALLGLDAVVQPLAKASVGGFALQRFQKPLPSQGRRQIWSRPIGWNHSVGLVSGSDFSDFQKFSCFFAEKFSFHLTWGLSMQMTQHDGGEVHAWREGWRPCCGGNV
jgi:hypothetical protein